MPVIRIELLAGRTQEQKRELAEAITKETVRIAKAKTENVHVIFTDVEPDQWANGGKFMSDPR